MLTYLLPWQLWTEKASRDFIELEYPWFLKTYDRYSFPVQRVDAVRYFLLLHYGGIYIDLDNVRASDPILYFVPRLGDPSPLGTICSMRLNRHQGKKMPRRKHHADGARPLSPKPLSDGVVLTILLCSRAVAPVSSR